MKQLIVTFCTVVALGVAATAAAGQEPGGPVLEIPQPTPEQLAASGWEGRALSNSVKAWFYNPSMVKPLAEVGQAVDENVLPFSTRRMLMTVVASRNQCLY